MTDSLWVATIQLTSTKDTAANIARACALCEAAADAGAQLAVLPENLGFMGAEKDKLPFAGTLEESEFLSPLREVAARRGLSIVAGSVPETGPDSRRVYNTCAVIAADGSILTSYRKIHLFDVELSDGFVISESDCVAPGAEAVIAEVEGWRIGLSICYDLRFPELYRQLSERGVDIITVPAAFTLHTGKDHWDVLLRARAIENQCFVIASGQFGSHGGNRFTWGKSQVIGPWGGVLSMVPEREGFALAQLRRDDLKATRDQIPALNHRRHTCTIIEN